MALAIEPDFLSIKAAKPQESPARGGESSARGEAFANTLTQARNRDSETDTPKAAPPESAAAAFVLPPPPPEPDLAAPASEGELAAAVPAVETPDLAPEVTIAAPAPEAGKAVLADPALNSELETDRTLAAARTEIELAAPQETEDARLAPETGRSPLPAETPETATEVAPTAPTRDNIQTAQAEVPADAPPRVSGEVAALVAAAAPKVTDTGKTEAVSATAGILSEVQASKPPVTAQPVKTADIPLDPVFAVEAAADETASTVLAGSGSKLSGTETLSQTTPAVPALSLSAATPAAPQAAPAPVAAPVMTPTHALLTASPAGVVDIVAKSAGDGQSDRVVVQLDPPELGRVSIDFKFDAQGLQHITITGETPEALRQLRLMHFELANALDRQGIGGHTMTFQQQQQGAQSSPSPGPFGNSGAGEDSTGLAAAALLAADRSNMPRTLPGGRLDIRL